VAAVTEQDAIRELQACGVDEPEQLLEHATPDRIVATCQWWRTRSNVTTGLLVSRIRKGGMEAVDSPPSVRQQLRQQFEAYVARFEVGSTLEPHARLQVRRRYQDELCGGGMVVYEAAYPSLFAECSGCSFEAAYPLKVLKALA
jgi:hypothetical protein